MKFDPCSTAIMASVPPYKGTEYQTITEVGRQQKCKGGILNCLSFGLPGLMKRWHSTDTDFMKTNPIIQGLGWGVGFLFSVIMVDSLLSMRSSVSLSFAVPS